MSDPIYSKPCHGLTIGKVNTDVPLESVELPGLVPEVGMVSVDGRFRVVEVTTNSFTLEPITQPPAD